MSTPDNISIISFEDLEDDSAVAGSGIQNWLTQQCRFLVYEPPKDRTETYETGRPAASVLKNRRDSATDSEEGGEAALRADSPLLGFGLFPDHRTFVDPLHFPSATYVRDLPEQSSKNKQYPESFHSSNKSTRGATPTSSHSSTRGAHSTSSSSARSSVTPFILRRPQQQQPQVVPPPPLGRSRAASNASISNYHLPTSMQLASSSSSHTPAPSALPPRYSRITHTPPASSTFASFPFNSDPSTASATRPLPSRPPGHYRDSAARQLNQPSSSFPPQKSLSRSSLALSQSSFNNRNAVYLDVPIDIEVDADSEDDRPTPQLYLGAEGPKIPTRPLPVPPYHSPSLRGAAFVDEDADHTAALYSNHRQHVAFEEQYHEETDSDETQSNYSDLTDTNYRCKSRWSVTSSMDGNVSSSSGGVGPSKRGDIDKEEQKRMDKKTSRLVSMMSRISSNIPHPPSFQHSPTSPTSKDRPSSSNVATHHPPSSFQRPTTNKDRPPSNATTVSTASTDGFEVNLDMTNIPDTTLGFWFGDNVPPPPPVLSPTLGGRFEGPSYAGVGGKKWKDRNRKNREEGKAKKPSRARDKREVDAEEEDSDEEETGQSTPASMPGADPTQKLAARVDTNNPSGGQPHPQRIRLQSQQHSPQSLFRQLSRNNTTSSTNSTNSNTNSNSSSNPHQLTTSSASTKGLKHVTDPLVKVFSDGTALDFMGMRSVTSLGSRVVLGGGGQKGQGGQAVRRGLRSLRNQGIITLSSSTTSTIINGTIASHHRYKKKNIGKSRTRGRKTPRYDFGSHRSPIRLLTETLQY